MQRYWQLAYSTEEYGKTAMIIIRELSLVKGNAAVVKWKVWLNQNGIKKN